MGKKAIESFLYNGISEWYLRIPLKQPKGAKGKRGEIYNPQYFKTEYLPKDKYSLLDALERRLEIVKDAEDKGLRNKIAFSNTSKTSAIFIKEATDGLYDKYK